MNLGTTIYLVASYNPNFSLIYQSSDTTISKKSLFQCTTLGFSMLWNQILHMTGLNYT